MAERTPRWPRRVGRGIAELWGPPPTGWHYSNWAPRHSGKVWSGQNVMTGLVETIKAHVDNTWRSRQYPLIIGCTPWMNDPEVCQALMDVPTCLVIGKPDRVLRYLAAEDTGRRAVAAMDRTLDRLPGLAGLRIYSAAARHADH